MLNKELRTLKSIFLLLTLSCVITDSAAIEGQLWQRFQQCQQALPSTDLYQQFAIAERATLLQRQELPIYNLFDYLDYLNQTPLKLNQELQGAFLGCQTRLKKHLLDHIQLLKKSGFISELAQAKQPHLQKLSQAYLTLETILLTFELKNLTTKANYLSLLRQRTHITLKNQACHNEHYPNGLINLRQLNRYFLTTSEECGQQAWQQSRQLNDQTFNQQLSQDSSLPSQLHFVEPKRLEKYLAKINQNPLLVKPWQLPKQLMLEARPPAWDSYQRMMEILAALNYQIEPIIPLNSSDKQQPQRVRIWSKKRPVAELLIQTADNNYAQVIQKGVIGTQLAQIHLYQRAQITTPQQQQQWLMMLAKIFKVIANPNAFYLLSHSADDAELDNLYQYWFVDTFKKDSHWQRIYDQSQWFKHSYQSQVFVSKNFSNKIHFKERLQGVKYLQQALMPPLASYLNKHHCDSVIACYRTLFSSENNNDLIWVYNQITGKKLTKTSFWEHLENEVYQFDNTNTDLTAGMQSITRK
ncbi:hypothetical protein [Paraferrimonas sp. SM1919]|uniref:hypothetical protein n=1 Tax=Paraferrimonas sp. SM1919 TaxID=2662263 RepID=UPI0013D10DAF|nr:hypothetical protein [Paraferrimonas sp. SM1919]